MRSSFLFRFALIVPLLGVISGCDGQINDLPTTPDPVITTETFTGTLNINGGATHLVFTTATGAVTATLTSLGDNPPSKVGFSMGTTSGTTCTTVLSNDNAIVTTVLQGTVGSLAGSLCMRVYDTGALTETIPYTFTVTHP